MVGIQKVSQSTPGISNCILFNQINVMENVENLSIWSMSKSSGVNKIICIRKHYLKHLHPSIQSV